MGCAYSRPSTRGLAASEGAGVNAVEVRAQIIREFDTLRERDAQTIRQLRAQLAARNAGSSLDTEEETAMKQQIFEV
mgnify:CR=1 FL=1